MLRDECVNHVSTSNTWFNYSSYCLFCGQKMAATNASDEAISQIIRRKLEPYGRVSYLEIATASYHMERRRLATMILDMEQHAADQVGE